MRSVLAENKGRNSCQGGLVIETMLTVHTSELYHVRIRPPSVGMDGK